MRKNRMVIYLLLGFILLGGCSETKILEELALVTAYGLDWDEENNKLLGTSVIYQFDPELTNETQLVHSSGRSLREVIHGINAKTSKQLEQGQLRAIVYQDKLAEQGIAPHIDAVRRHPQLSNRLYLTISDVPTSELLNVTNIEESPNSGIYVYRLLDNAMRNEVIFDTTLQEFIKQMTTIGNDPALPVLSIEDDKIVIGKIAFFQDDRLVGTLDIEDAFFVRFIIDNFGAGEFFLDIPSDPYLSYIENDHGHEISERIYLIMEELSGVSEIKLDNPESYEFTLEGKISGQLLELSENLQLNDPAVIKQLEQDISQAIEERIKQIIDSTQEWNSDAFGFGSVYNSKVRSGKLSKEEWRKEYPNFNIQVDIELIITNYGTLE